MTSTDQTTPRPCYCLWESWAGRTRQDGEIVGETPHFYLVRFLNESHGQPAGRTRLVNKRHVRFDAPAPEPKP